MNSTNDNFIIENLLKANISELGLMTMFTKFAKYHLGQVVRHKAPFRGVVFDVDPEFNNSDEWYENLPEDGRPSKEQPFITYLLKMRIHFMSRMCQSRI